MASSASCKPCAASWLSLDRLSSRASGSPASWGHPLKPRLSGQDVRQVAQGDVPLHHLPAARPLGKDLLPAFSAVRGERRGRGEANGDTDRGAMSHLSAEKSTETCLALKMPSWRRMFDPLLLHRLQMHLLNLHA